MDPTIENYAASTRFLNFANPNSSSIGTELRDNVLSVAGAQKNVSVVIACNTVTLYGYAENSYATKTIDQLTEAGGEDCTVIVV